MHKTCQPFHLSVFLQVEVCPTSQTYQEVQRSTHSQLIQIKFQQNQPPKEKPNFMQPFTSSKAASIFLRLLRGALRLLVARR